MTMFSHLLQKGGSMSYVNAGDVYGGEGTKKNKFHFSYVNEWYGKAG